MGDATIYLLKVMAMEMAPVTEYEQVVPMVSLRGPLKGWFDIFSEQVPVAGPVASMLAEALVSREKRAKIGIFLGLNDQLDAIEENNHSGEEKASAMLKAVKQLKGQLRKKFTYSDLLKAMGQCGYLEVQESLRGNVVEELIAEGELKFFRCFEGDRGMRGWALAREIMKRQFEDSAMEIICVLVVDEETVDEEAGSVYVACTPKFQIKVDKEDITKEAFIARAQKLNTFVFESKSRKFSRMKRAIGSMPYEEAGMALELSEEQVAQIQSSNHLADSKMLLLAAEDQNAAEIFTFMATHGERTAAKTFMLKHLEAWKYWVWIIAFVVLFGIVLVSLIASVFMYYQCKTPVPMPVFVNLTSSRAQNLGYCFIDVSACPQCQPTQPPQEWKNFSIRISWNTQFVHITAVPSIAGSSNDGARAGAIKLTEQSTQRLSVFLSVSVASWSLSDWKLFVGYNEATENTKCSLA